MPSDIEEAISIPELKNQLSLALQAKFLLVNQDRVVKFKQQLEKDCDKLLKVSRMMVFPRDFTNLINEYNEQFYKQFEAGNMAIFEQVTQKYLDTMNDLQSQGAEMDGDKQQQLIVRAEQEADRLALAHFEQVANNLIGDIQAKMKA